jgi:Flp pilus assembly protein TadD
LLLDRSATAGWVKLGNALLRSSDAPEAAKAYRTALDQRPELAAAHNGLGAALLAQADLDAAERELKQAAELDPHDAHPLLNLARLYKRRGAADQAAQAVAQAEARDPSLWVASSTVSEPQRPAAR